MAHHNQWLNHSIGASRKMHLFATAHATDCIARTYKRSGVAPSDFTPLTGSVRIKYSYDAVGTTITNTGEIPNQLPGPCDIPNQQLNYYPLNMVAARVCHIDVRHILLSRF